MTNPEHSELSPDLLGVIRRAAPVVTVLGDFLLDEWWHGSTERVAREAPAPVVDLTDRSPAPGGAANTAMNLAALGARVRAVGVIGRDAAGEHLRELLGAAGVDVIGLLSFDSVTTTTKIRVVGAGQLLVRVDDTFRGEYRGDVLRAVTAAAIRWTRDADAEVICDYGSEVLTPSIVDALAARSSRPPLTVIDAHDPAKWAALRPQLATPNAQEAARLLHAGTAARAVAGAATDRAALFAAAAGELLASTGAEAVVVTLDHDGTILLRPGTAPHRTWARPVAEKQAAGAGDTYVAALTLGRCIGLPLSVSADLAQAAADVVVQRPGTSVCSSEDLEHHLAQSEAVLDEEELARRLRADRDNGRRIVLTNGCFDVLHRGHTTYLNQARALGDILVVAVNGDESTRRLKGAGRPVNPAADRAGLLAALGCVDYVTVFDTDTPIPLIERLRPDVYAKGGDYTPTMLEETAVVTAYGGEVRILDYVPFHSTTAVVERILESGRHGPMAIDA